MSLLKNLTYRGTDDIHTALASNKYIGEDVLRPRVLPYVIHGMLTGYRLPFIPVYYYGEPDDHLKERFGYD